MLNRINRLKKNKEFNYIYKKGKYINSSNFTINYAKTYLKFPKFGVSVGKKIGNSVMRSRTKRIMNEVIRLNIDKVAVNNYVIVLKPSFASKTFFEIQYEFLSVLEHANLLTRQSNE